MLTNGQTLFLRRMLDGDSLLLYSGGVPYNCWARGGKYASVTVVNALSQSGLIESEGPKLAGMPRTWRLTDAGRQALKEYEARHPCDVANGDNDASG